MQGEIAKQSDENWIKINLKLRELIKADREKSVHFNSYLEKWKAERLELSTLAMSLDEVLLILEPIS